MKIHNIHFDTYPFVFHHHGRPARSRHPMGIPLKERAFNELSGGHDLGTFRGRKEGVLYPIPPENKIRHPINDKLTIFMVTNLQETGSAARCLDHYGIKYSLTGKDIKKFDGNEKLKAIIDFIPTVTTEYVMLLDSDDIFLFDDFSHLVETYEQLHDCRMLFQAEGFNFPKGNIEMDEFEKQNAGDNGPYKHLNAGIWIANTQFLKSVYEDMINIQPHTPGDQPVFKELYKKHYPLIKIDSRCRFFQSLSWSTWFDAKYPGVLQLEYQS